MSSERNDWITFWILEFGSQRRMPKEARPRNHIPGDYKGVVRWPRERQIASVDAQCYTETMSSICHTPGIIVVGWMAYPHLAVIEGGVHTNTCRATIRGMRRDLNWIGLQIRYTMMRACIWTCMKGGIAGLDIQLQKPRQPIESRERRQNCTFDVSSHQCEMYRH